LSPRHSSLSGEYKHVWNLKPQQLNQIRKRESDKDNREVIAHPKTFCGSVGCCPQNLPQQEEIKKKIWERNRCLSVPEIVFGVYIESTGAAISPLPKKCFSSLDSLASSTAVRYYHTVNGRPRNRSFSFLA